MNLVVGARGILVQFCRIASLLPATSDLNIAGPWDDGMSTNMNVKLFKWDLDNLKVSFFFKINQSKKTIIWKNHDLKKSWLSGIVFWGIEFCCTNLKVLVFFSK